jgi:DNA-binding CsgD family transcriptional regulator
MPKKITACPGWLSLSADRTSFVLTPECSQLVRQIFHWSVDGLGAHTIAKRLNTIGAPTFGPSKHWNASTISNLLCNRATLGELCPKKRLGRKVVEVSDQPIRNYYPRAIEEPLFRAAREASRKNFANGRGSKANLFAGIAICYYCGAPIKICGKGLAKSLVCANVITRQACRQRTAWGYQDFEMTFLNFCELNHFSTELDDLIKRLKGTCGSPNKHEARLDIGIFLRRNLQRLAIATNGRAKILETDSIRRNRPDRFFELQFGEHALIVRPLPPMRKLGPKLDSPSLAEVLGVTNRQAEIIALLVEGLSLKESARRLQISFETTRWHLREIFRKANVHAQSELIDLATKAASG